MTCLAVARPKSPILTWSLLSMKTFVGLRSLCWSITIIFYSKHEFSFNNFDSEIFLFNTILTENLFICIHALVRWAENNVNSYNATDLGTIWPRLWGYEGSLWELKMFWTCVSCLACGCEQGLRWSPKDKTVYSMSSKLY